MAMMNPTTKHDDDEHCKSININNHHNCCKTNDYLQFPQLQNDDHHHQSINMMANAKLSSQSSPTPSSSSNTMKINNNNHNTKNINKTNNDQEKIRTKTTMVICNRFCFFWYFTDNLFIDFFY